MMISYAGSVYYASIPWSDPGVRCHSLRNNLGFECYAFGSSSYRKIGRTNIVV